MVGCYIDFDLWVSSDSGHSVYGGSEDGEQQDGGRRDCPYRYVSDRSGASELFRCNHEGADEEEDRMRGEMIMKRGLGSPVLAWGFLVLMSVIWVFLAASGCGDSGLLKKAESRVEQLEKETQLLGLRLDGLSAALRETAEKRDLYLIQIEEYQKLIDRLMQEDGQSSVEIAVCLRYKQALQRMVKEGQEALK